VARNSRNSRNSGGGGGDVSDRGNSIGSVSWAEESRGNDDDEWKGEKT
jgi:hypothetical protein